MCLPLLAPWRVYLFVSIMCFLSPKLHFAYFSLKYLFFSTQIAHFNVIMKWAETFHTAATLENLVVLQESLANCQHAKRGLGYGSYILSVCVPPCSIYILPNFFVLMVTSRIWRFQINHETIMQNKWRFRRVDHFQSE
jgi:hypothetical protein